MENKIKSFIAHLIDGLFLGQALAFAWMEEWNYALWHTIAGLTLIALDVLGMVWEHKEESKGE